MAEGNSPASAAGAGAGEPTRALQKKRTKVMERKGKKIMSISQPGKGRREQKTGKCVNFTWQEVFTQPGKRIEVATSEC